MKEDVSNPNIEWKKNKADASERITLKVNHKEAAAYEATKKNALKTPIVPIAENLPKGLKKIRKKIRNIDNRSGYEDEEDEDGFQFVPDGLEELNQANSLLNALNEEEIRILKQQESLNHMKMQQTAGRMEALAVAANMARQAGINGAEKKIVKKNQQSVAPLEDITKLTVRDILSEKEHIKGEKVPEGKVIQTLRGVKRVKQIGGNNALKGLSLEAIQKAGEMDAREEDIAKIAAKENNALAKKILAKSGQEVKRKKKREIKDVPNKAKEKSGLSLKRNLSLKNLNDRT